MNNFLAKVDSFAKKAKEFSQEKKQEIIKSIKGYQSPNSLKKGVFGVELKDSLTISETRGLPTVVATCLDFLSKHTSEVGIYRVSASVKEINALAKEFQDGQNYKIVPEADVHAVAAVLKMYLRELPKCIIPDDVKRIFFDLQNSKDSTDINPKSDNDAISDLCNACQFLSLENSTLAYALFSHLHQVMKDSDNNKMGLLNLQLIFSPCLNIEPVIVQYFIKYPEILRKQKSSQNTSYTLVDSTEHLQSVSVEAPQKPVRARTKKKSEMEDSKAKILDEKKNSDSFVVIGQILHDMYYKDKCMSSQKEFLAWTKAQLGFSKSTTYEYIISWKIYSELEEKLKGTHVIPPTYQSHCQLLAKVPKELLVEAWIGVNSECLGGAANITTSFLESFLERNGYLRTSSSRDKGIKKEKKKRKVAKKVKYDESESEEEEDFQEEEGNLEVDLQNLEEYNQENSGNRDLQDFPTTPNRQVKGGLGNRSSSRIAAKASLKENFKKSDNGGLGTPPPTAYSTPNIGKMGELPVDVAFLKMIGKNVVLGQEFDVAISGIEEFEDVKDWYGRVWCAIPELKADGIEKALQVIFTKFSSKEFAEGLFLIRAEIGADWCTPVLQHPYCVMRQLKDEFISETFDTFIAFYLGPNMKEFCQIFKTVGLIPGVNSWSAMLPIQAPNFNLLHQQAQFLPQMNNLDYITDSNKLEEVVSALCDMGKGI